MSGTALGVAFPSGALIDPDTGDISVAWRQFFVALYQRTGGAGGADAGGAVSDLAAETAARTAADTTLTNNLAAETLARSNADAAETAARVAADQALALGTVNAVTGALRTGITDGSNAAPGQIGEYLSASSSSTTLTNGAVVNIVSIALTPGDWDVIGSVFFITPSGGSGFLFGVGLGGVLNTIISTTFQAGPSNQALSTALVRYNITAATTVWVVAQANFTGTAATASGSIRARRMR